MKILLVTEKFNPDRTQRDGGYQLVCSLKKAFGDDLRIMQFSCEEGLKSDWCFQYPFKHHDRFQRRLLNAEFIAKKIKEVEKNFSHIIFIHISMQFGLVKLPLQEDKIIWTFPMFLTASYRFSGENVPDDYFQAEKVILKRNQNILTPSHLEKKQLIEIYGVMAEQIHVIPRGVNMQYISAQKRHCFGDSLKFCSIGSIKPQKNTLGLIDLFTSIKAKYKNATLKIIGSVQNQTYYKKVIKHINNLNMIDAIQLTGYIAPNDISAAIKNMHLHISVSQCETFGRAIFETLAAGLPNVANLKNNAAADFLKYVPYAHFVNNNQEALIAIERILTNYSKLSRMALEIGQLYDDKFLSKLLAAEISCKPELAISDFDGTLYHKNDAYKTEQAMNVFRQHSVKVVCSARPISYLLEKLKFYNIKVDWLIGYSGSVVADGNGKVIWSVPIKHDYVNELEANFSQTYRITMGEEILQLSMPAYLKPKFCNLRTEIYQDEAFVFAWQASKLHAIHRLLSHIDYSGRVKVFGDGRYDTEMLTYFDGTLVKE